MGRPFITARGLFWACLLAADGDLSELGRGGAVLVHVALHLHRQELSRRHQSLGDIEGVLAAQASAAPRLTEASELALREGSVDHNEVGVAGDDARCRIANRRADAASTAAVDHRGEGVMRQIERRRESVGVVAVGGVGREAVEHTRLEAGVGAGCQDRFERETKLRPSDPSVLGVLGLAHADHGHPVADVAVILVRHLSPPSVDPRLRDFSAYPRQASNAQGVSDVRFRQSSHRRPRISRH